MGGGGGEAELVMGRFGPTQFQDRDENQKGEELDIYHRNCYVGK